MLELRNVKKKFKNKIVLDGVSFKVDNGQCVALMGPNGSGKTTTIRAILGLISIDEGEIKRDFSVKREVGVMHQNDYFPDNLRVAETIELHKSYYKSKVDTNYLLKIVDLENEKKVLVANLSGGQKRRLSFAISIASDPKILFLDEPTVGMDVQACKAFWTNIKKIKEKQKTVFVTLHHLDELNDYCNRFIFLKDGKIIKDVNKLELVSTKIIIISGNEEEVSHVQQVLGGNIEDDKLYICDMKKRDSIIDYLNKNNYRFEERFKEVKDIYRELYM